MRIDISFQMVVTIDDDDDGFKKLIPIMIKMVK
jgi:hypothetical protein